MTDEEIAALTPAERRDLILRLAPDPGGMLSLRTIERIRKWRTVLMLVCVAALIPWTVLPGRHPAQALRRAELGRHLGRLRHPAAHHADADRPDLYPNRKLPPHA